MAQSAPLGATAPASSCAQSADIAESGPVDLHALHMRNAACGYTSDLELRSRTVQRITARLRAISAITAILMVESGGEDINLGDWIRQGLLEGVHALASDAEGEIDQAHNHRAASAGAAVH